jgi:hypothetical protein
VARSSLRQLGRAFVMRRPAFRRQTRRPSTASFVTRALRASRSVILSFQPPTVTSVATGCRPPWVRGSRVAMIRELLPIPPAGPRRTRPAASVANSRPAGGRRPGCTCLTSIWAASAVRASASAFSRRRASSREEGGRFGRPGVLMTPRPGPVLQTAFWSKVPGRTLPTATQRKDSNFDYDLISLGRQVANFVFDRLDRFGAAGVRRGACASERPCATQFRGLPARGLRRSGRGGGSAHGPRLAISGSALPGVASTFGAGRLGRTGDFRQALSRPRMRTAVLDTKGADISTKTTPLGQESTAAAKPAISANSMNPTMSKLAQHYALS